MQLITFKDWCQQNDITKVSGVFASAENKYPTILCINGADEKRPLVLSKNAGSKWPLGTDAVEFAKDAFVTTYTREDGVTISKLSTNLEMADVDNLWD